MCFDECDQIHGPPDRDCPKQTARCSFQQAELSTHRSAYLGPHQPSASSVAALSIRIVLGVRNLKFGSTILSISSSWTCSGGSGCRIKCFGFCIGSSG